MPAHATARGWSSGRRGFGPRCRPRAASGSSRVSAVLACFLERELLLVLSIATAQASSFLTVSGEPFARFTEQSEFIFSGTVVSSEHRIVPTTTGPTGSVVVSVNVDTMIRGTPAKTILVAFALLPYMKIPRLGDGVVMATNTWPVEPSMTIVNTFVRSAAVEGGLGTVDEEGRWLGTVSCEAGFASAAPDEDEDLIVSGPDHLRPPLSVWEGPDPEKEDRMRRNAAPWELASATLVQCLLAASR